MKLALRLSGSILQLAFAFLLMFATSGCTVKWVADYDSASFEEILKVGKGVDKFYGELLEESQGNRAYQKSSSRYVELETDIRALVTRNKARALNQESTEISEIILALWVKYKEAHKSRNSYPDGAAKLDRNRFIRLFAAAASAETAKKLDADDKDAGKESK